MTADPTVRSGSQIRAIIELFKNAGLSLTNLYIFLTVLEKGVLLDTPSVGEGRSQILSNISISISPWISLPKLNQGMFGISSLLKIGHFLVHVSAMLPFLIPWATTSNAESLLSESVNKFGLIQTCFFSHHHHHTCTKKASSISQSTSKGPTARGPMMWILVWKPEKTKVRHPSSDRQARSKKRANSSFFCL